MAMTGTGTQADPYIVGTWDELVTACSSYGVYVRLGADIDMNDEYPEGITSGCDLNCCELDGDGHRIKNISAKNKAYIFHASYSTISIKNIDFANTLLTLDASNPGISFFIDAQNRTVNFYLCTFSGRWVGTGYTTYISRGVVTFTRCAFNIEMQGAFRTTYEDNWFIFDYTNAKFTGSFTSYLYFVLKNSYLTGTLTGGNSVWLVTGSTSSVIDAECPAVNGNSADHCLANSDKVSESISVATPVTTAQLTDAAYLDSIGFPIQT